MLAESHDEEQIIARVAALDIGKAELVCCVRVPAPAGGKRRLQEVSTHSTMPRSLSELANRLVEMRVERVVMEATSSYWKPVFYLLEAHGLDPWLVNARDVKHLPGRPKTDVLDAVWLCKVAERQMLRPSFVPPWPMGRLRDLTRYRTDLVAARTAEKNRVEKLLEDACIKLSVVASDIFGVSGRAMLAALVAGERDPKDSPAGAGTDARQDRSAGTGLRRAFQRPSPVLAATHVVADRGARRRHRRGRHQIETQLAPFAEAATQLDEIPGIGPVAAAAIIAEIGVDMSRFPTAGHLCSWAKFALGINSPAGKTKRSASSGHGSPYLARVLGEAAVGTSKTNTFLAARYRRIARRRGQPRAVVAVGRSILVIIWHLLHDPDARFQDLGADHYTRHVDPSVKKRSHIRQLEALGYTVTLTPAA